MWSLVIPRFPHPTKITLLANLGQWLTPTKLVVASDRVCWSIGHENNISIVVNAYVCCYLLWPFWLWVIFLMYKNLTHLLLCLCLESNTTSASHLFSLLTRIGAGVLSVNAGGEQCIVGVFFFFTVSSVCQSGVHHYTLHKVNRTLPTYLAYLASLSSLRSLVSCFLNWSIRIKAFHSTLSAGNLKVEFNLTVLCFCLTSQVFQLAVIMCIQSVLWVCTWSLALDCFS